MKSIYIFSNESSNPNSCPSPTTGREICVTEIVTSHDLSPSSSPRRAVEKPWNRYAGARGNRWKKEEHDTGAVHRMEQKWRKPAQRRRKGRKSKKRPEGLLAECGLEKWGHVFSVKLLESLARSSLRPASHAVPYTRSQRRSFNWLALWIYRASNIQICGHEFIYILTFLPSSFKKVEIFFVNKRRN